MNPRSLQTLSRRDPAVAQIARDWRALTSGKVRRSGRTLGPGEPTLIACSGGADSSALVLALAAVTSDLVVAHIVHDMRPPEQALSDRDAVQTLAERLGLPFVQAPVHVRPTHHLDQAAPPRADRNAEQLARRLRYAALARLAQDLGIRWIAAAHHAQDQTETILMRLLRGSGPAGLRGIAPRRRLAENVQLIRPMLAVTRADAERLCRESGWVWREDATNADASRLRAAVRTLVAPPMRTLSPSLDSHAAAAAGLFRDLTGLLRDRAIQVEKLAAIDHKLPSAASNIGADSTIRWSRDILRGERAVVIGELLRRAHTRLSGEPICGAGSRVLSRVSTAVRDTCGDPRRFAVSGVIVEVTSRTVEVRRVEPHD